MDDTYRASLNALSSADPRLRLAANNLNLHHKKDWNVVTSSGLGEAILNRRERKSADRAKNSAARAARKRNR